MSAIATLIKGERAVRPGDSCERAQELDSVVFRYLPMFYKRAFRFLGMQQTRKMPSKMPSSPLTGI